MMFIIGWLLFLGAPTNVDQEKQPFFDFNEVDHYSTTISDDDTHALSEWDTSMTREEIREVYVLDGILSWAFPKTLNDTAFFDGLSNQAFKKTVLPESSVQGLKEVFSAPVETDGVADLCSPVYRDILVFRKDAKVTGIAKICFTCSQSYVLGTVNDNYKYFGLLNRYGLLRKILYPQH